MRGGALGAGDPAARRAQKHRLKDQEAWTAHLERLGITYRLRVHPDPLKIVSEGAL